jgi:hypothetical protein
MLHDPKIFETTSAGPLSGPKFQTPAQIAAAKRERREQDKALALMLTYVAILVASIWIWGVQGLVGWALTSAALAGAWVLHTTRGIRGTADE